MIANEHFKCIKWFPTYKPIREQVYIPTKTAYSITAMAVTTNENETGPNTSNNSRPGTNGDNKDANPLNIDETKNSSGAISLTTNPAEEQPSQQRAAELEVSESTKLLKHSGSTLSQKNSKLKTANTKAIRQRSQSTITSNYLPE